MGDYKGEERREDIKNGLYIKFDLKDYLETQFNVVHEKLKILDTLPCGVHSERMKGIKGQIGWLWFLVSGIILGMVGIVFVFIK